MSAGGSTASARGRGMLGVIVATLAVMGPALVMPFTAGAESLTAVAAGSVWRYLDNGSNQGTAWRDEGFDDTTWNSGPAQLGYGDGDEATVVSYGPSSSNKYLTTYFRTTFNIDNAAAVTAADLGLLRDDGAVVYLNGTEVLRSNLPTGTITNTTRAVTNSTGSDQSTYHPATAPTSLLHNGTNTIAVEVHQQRASSSDLSFDLTLTLTTSGTTTTTTTTPTTTTAATTTTGAATTTTAAGTTTTTTTGPSGTFTAVAAGSVWRYLDNGSNQGTAWRDEGFDDTTWNSGPAQLGYGDGDEATVVSYGPSSSNRYLTTYFRTTFNIDNAAAVTAADLGLLRDDGAVVYLNGTEVLRSNLPTGTVTNTTRASSGLWGTAERAWIPATAPTSLLHNGTNTIAVEVHQDSKSSSDLSFDLTLTVTFTGGTTTTSTTTTAPTTTTTTPGATTTTLPGSGGDVLLAAGDLGKCGGKPGPVGDLIRSQPGQFLALGDLAYPSGSPTDFANCYHPYFGSEVGRTRPVPGNHEYDTGSLAGYIGEFGAARATPNGTTWYSFEVGNWHVVMLDANCGKIGGCGVNSAEYQWLAADLAASSTPCLIAAWHQTPWSSHAGYKSPTDIVPFMQLLQQEGADLVLAGHVHDYERFARKNASGALDPNGFRTIVVGSGGGTAHSAGTAITGSEARQSGTYGVVRLDLAADGYSWRFLPIAGSTWTDSGSDHC